MRPSNRPKAARVGGSKSLIWSPRALAATFFVVLFVQAMEDGQPLLDEQKDAETVIDQLQHQDRKLAEEFHGERFAVTQNSSTLMCEDVRVAQVLHWSIRWNVGENRSSCRWCL